MTIQHIEGKNKGHIMLYALSTCGWCRKTKRYLNELGVEYYYQDVDRLDGDEKDQVRKEVEKWNPRCSYPTLVVNKKDCIVGFDPEKINGALDI